MRLIEFLRDHTRDGPKRRARFRKRRRAVRARRELPAQHRPSDEESGSFPTPTSSRVPKEPPGRLRESATKGGGLSPSARFRASFAPDHGFIRPYPKKNPR